MDSLIGIHGPSSMDEGRSVQLLQKILEGWKVQRWNKRFPKRPILSTGPFFKLYFTLLQKYDRSEIMPNYSSLD